MHDERLRTCAMCVNDGRADAIAKTSSNPGTNHRTVRFRKGTSIGEAETLAPTVAQMREIVSRGADHWKAAVIVAHRYGNGPPDLR